MPKPPPAFSIELQKYVDAHHNARDPKLQDRVGAARIRLAYAQGSQKNWTAARAAFLQTVHEYRGTGKVSSDFGGVPDQAAYQAAVCLIAEGKTQAGEAEMVAFMKKWPESPLVTAASRRIARLHGGVTPEANAQLLQKDLDLQQKKIQLEAGSCGPKCIAALLDQLGRKHPAYGEIATLCGQGNQGVSCEGMKKGLAALGQPVYPYELSAEDFAHLKAPAILVRPNHYVLLREIRGRKAIVYDPLTAVTSEDPLPTDPYAPIPVLLTSPLAPRS